MVWDTSPSLTLATIFLRVISSVIPVAQLWVGKLIIDQVVRAIQGRLADPHRIWVYLAYEIGLAVLSAVALAAVIGGIGLAGTLICRNARDAAQDVRQMATKDGSIGVQFV